MKGVHDDGDGDDDDKATKRRREMPFDRLNVESEAE